jgi:hypothetical protein
VRGSGYVVPGGKRERVRRLGSAVTPPVAEILIAALAEAITGEPTGRAACQQGAHRMSRLVSVPDWGDSGSRYQWIEVPEPGDDGYPMAELPEADPWAPVINQAIRQIEADAGPPGAPAARRAEYLAWEPEPEAGP